MATALIMQYQLEMEPCPLCTTQRFFVIAVGILSLVAFIHNPPSLVRRIYCSVGIIFAIIGGGVSARHVWLQHLPEDQVPACGPGLSYMFETLPFWDALSVLFQGNGNCADVVWTFLGLSIPEWTLICFATMVIMQVFIWARKS